MALESSYTAQSAGSATPGNTQLEGKKEDYWDLSKLRKCYTDYLFSKRQEIDEQIDARRYYHGSQWTTEQIKAMQRRKQPVMTFNRVARKIDGVIGLVEKLRQDPKAYARTPQHEEGADLATAVLRYVLDESQWKTLSAQVAQDAAVDGIGGIELEITQGDKGDPEISADVVDVQAFFYDPRCYKDDFSDGRYHGVGKWLDQDIAEQMFPNAELYGLAGDWELTTSSDREMRWFHVDGVVRRVRVVDIWYQHNGGWCYAIFTGSKILQEGRSPFQNEKKKDFSKYLMLSGNVDQDGDRYGFVRNMKSAQDGINARQSKMQHILASKRLVVSQGAVDDIEKLRNEWARPDGVVVTNRPVNEGFKADDQSFDFAGWTKMLELNLAEIENFGPNPALIGQGLESQSGRAIQLLQQAGMAELGPYILALRGWKLRVYRAIWNAVQNHWKAERWVRVTDNDDLAQYIQINGMQTDPQTGQPTMVNVIGSLDVDIILDEGPDHVNSMADVYETLSNILPSVAPLLAPPQAQAVIAMLMDTSPLPNDIKKRFRDQMQQAAQEAAQMQQQPDPAVQAAQAKATIDLQAMQQKAGIEQQVGQLKLTYMATENQHKQTAAQIDLEHKRMLAELDLQCKQQCAEQEMNTKQRSAEHELGVSHAMNTQSLQHETAKAHVQLGAKHEESKIKHAEMKTKAEHDSKADAAKATQAEPALKGIAAELSKATQAMTEAAKAMAAPKKISITHDKSGRVSGATATPAH